MYESLKDIIARPKMIKAAQKLLRPHSLNITIYIHHMWFVKLRLAYDDAHGVAATPNKKIK